MKNHMAAAMKSVSRYQRRNARKNQRIVDIEAETRRDQHIDFVLSVIMTGIGLVVACLGVIDLFIRKMQ